MTRVITFLFFLSGVDLALAFFLSDSTICCIRIQDLLVVNNLLLSAFAPIGLHKYAIIVAMLKVFLSFVSDIRCNIYSSCSFDSDKLKPRPGEEIWIAGRLDTEACDQKNWRTKLKVTHDQK